MPNYQYGYYPTNWWKPNRGGPAAKPSKIDIESAKEKKKRARYTGPTFVPAMTAQQKMAQYYAELRARGTGISPTPEQANNAYYKKQWAKYQAGQAGYKAPPTPVTVQTPAMYTGPAGPNTPWIQYQKKTPWVQPNPAPGLGGLGYSSYYDFLNLSPFGQQAETTPAPTATPEYAGGGYGGGYGYPNYGWGGGGGGVNINFGGGKAQQQIARLPTTPRPDIQGWLQSLINWNIGG